MKPAGVYLRDGALMLTGIRDPCGLDEAEQPLQILLNTVLTKPFNLHDADRNITDVLLEYLDEIDQDSDVLSAWQRPSFYEWLIPRLELQEGNSFEKTRRSCSQRYFVPTKRFPTPPLISAIFHQHLEQKIHMPPVRIPLIP